MDLLKATYSYVLCLLLQFEEELFETREEFEKLLQGKRKILFTLSVARDQLETGLPLLLLSVIHQENRGR